MRTLLAIIVGLCLTTVCNAADFDPFQGPKPLAIFVQSDPWAMVIGSDTPRVAIYENGDVIFAKKLNERRAYHYVTLDKTELEKVRARFKPVLAVKDLKPGYNIRPNVTDQPEAAFYFRDGEREIATSVYGLMATGTKLPAYTEFPGDPKPTVPPDELLKLHKWLCELDYPDSKEWMPEYVEVMLSDYSYAPEASIQWPKDWPSLSSDRAIKRGDSYSIFLDGALLSKLREFLATEKEKGAVEIEGKKMAASYRFTFPGERAWREAFAAAGERAEKEEKQGERAADKHGTRTRDIAAFGVPRIAEMVSGVWAIMSVDCGGSIKSVPGSRCGVGARKSASARLREGFAACHGGEFACRAHDFACRDQKFACRIPEFACRDGKFACRIPEFACRDGKFACRIRAGGCRGRAFTCPDGKFACRDGKFTCRIQAVTGRVRAVTGRGRAVAGRVGKKEG